MEEETGCVAKSPFIEPATTKQADEEDEQTGQPGPYEKPNGFHGVNGHKRSRVIDLSDTKISPAGDEAVMAPFEYINSAQSKGVRDKLVQALNIWIEAPPEAVANVKAVVGDLHNISLMLDDVQDNSPMRRARPATQCVFGAPQTTNSAIYHMVDVISRTAAQNDTGSLEIVLDELKSLLVGQSHDLRWTHLVAVPTVQDYLRMVDGKTGGLFRMLSKFMIAQSTSPAAPATLDRLMTLFGRYFQIRDDYANLMSDQYTKTKGFAEDLDEGKYSFVLIHALHHAASPVREQLHNLLMQRRVAGNMASSQKEYVIWLLREAGSMSFTAEALRGLREDLEDEIRRIESATGRQNIAMQKILGALHVDTNVTVSNVREES
ncbi:geranylgeranyl pyrophosphate synthetase [Diaporthe helianthi]|uniref:Geranylgeranyl pyrophosphate synthetase n=1 Tax=Diaporthe helianthi TaxID=158607 RepID=A0A2P5HRV0_DIAHE|nr:geranylgeranyl pyrophosphate synthetase [Diaporthe helianthi]